jgi:hypothetical protein
LVQPQVSLLLLLLAPQALCVLLLLLQAQLPSSNKGICVDCVLSCSLQAFCTRLHQNTSASVAE